MESLKSTTLSTVDPRKINFDLHVCPKNKVRIAVLTAIISLALGSLILMQTSRHARLSLAHAKLIHDLKHKTQSEQDAAFNSYLANLNMGAAFNRIAHPLSADLDRKLKSAVTNLYAIITTIGLNDFTNASLLFRDLIKPNIADLLAVMPFEQHDHNLFRSVMQKAQTWLANVETLAKIEATAPKSLERDKNKITQQTMLALDLVNSLAALLGLANLSELEQTNLIFYKQGVLAGLPQLKQIPDGIVDLKELKELLDQLGVSVSIKSGNVPKKFNARLDEIRKSSDMFRTQLEELSTNINQLEGDRDKLRLSVYQDAKAVRSNLIQLLEVITHP